MKKSINVVLIGLVATFATTLTFAQSTSTSNHSPNASYAVETKFTTTTLPLADLKKKNPNIQVVTKAKSQKQITASNLQIGKFLTNTNAASLSKAQKLADGSFAITVNQTTSSIGHVAIKEAHIIYDDLGIVSVNMNIEKQKGRAFINAYLAKYGQPNNENVLDNFSWILGDYVLEIQENNNNYVAVYKKTTPEVQYLNEGVAVAVY